MPKDKVETCACNCSLQTGSHCIAWWNIIQSGLILTILLWLLTHVNFAQNPSSDQEIPVPLLELNIAIVSSTLNVILGITLLIGVRQKRPPLLKIWLYYMLIGIVLMVSYQIYKGVTLILAGQVGDSVVEFIKGCVCSIISSYLVIVVNRYYWIIIEEQTKEVASSPSA